MSALYFCTILAPSTNCPKKTFTLKLMLSQAKAFIHAPRGLILHNTIPALSSTGGNENNTAKCAIKIPAPQNITALLPRAEDVLSSCSSSTSNRRSKFLAASLSARLGICLSKAIIGTENTILVCACIKCKTKSSTHLSASGSNVDEDIQLQGAAEALT